MNGYLLDTNVISMLSPSRAGAFPAFAAWIEQMDARGRLFLSVVTIHELEKGLVLLEQKGATAKVAGLKVWLANLIGTYEDKVLDVDLLTARMSGQLEAKAIGAGQAPGMADATIAGIAMVHQLIVVTHNTRHFLPFDVQVRTPDEVANSERP